MTHRPLRRRAASRGVEVSLSLETRRSHSPSWILRCAERLRSADGRIRSRRSHADDEENRCVRRTAGGPALSRRRSSAEPPLQRSACLRARRLAEQREVGDRDLDRGFGRACDAPDTQRRSTRPWSRPPSARRCASCGSRNPSRRPALSANFAHWLHRERRTLCARWASGRDGARHRLAHRCERPPVRTCR